MQKWNVTPIEIALDLETPQPSDPTSSDFFGPNEPRICLLTGFALTAQLKRIVAAIDRAAPPRLPAGLRIGSAKGRSPSSSSSISIAPMQPLVRLQSKLIRAIEPGLAPSIADISFGAPRQLGSERGHFIRDFISSKAPPVFEPACPPPNLGTARLRPIGITIYRLGRQGAPLSILGRWRYNQSFSDRFPLRSAP